MLIYFCVCRNSNFFFFLKSFLQDEKDSDDENIPDLEDGDDAKKNGDDNKNSNKE